VSFLFVCSKKEAAKVGVTASLWDIDRAFNSAAVWKKSNRA